MVRVPGAYTSLSFSAPVFMPYLWLVLYNKGKKEKAARTQEERFSVIDKERLSRGAARNGPDEDHACPTHQAKE